MNSATRMLISNLARLIIANPERAVNVVINSPVRKGAGKVGVAIHADRGAINGSLVQDASIAAALVAKVSMAAIRRDQKEAWMWKKKEAMSGRSCRWPALLRTIATNGHEKGTPFSGTSQR
jgi:hypothetical protein